MTLETTSTQPRLSDASKAALDALLQRVTSSRELPALTLGVAGATGAPLYFAAAGERVFGDPEQGLVDDSTYLELYSQTKLVTAVAVLQLVDGGLVSLDDPAVVEKHAPELLAQAVLSYDDEGNEVLTPLAAPITLRTLLTHTSGQVYGFESPLLAKWEAAHRPPSVLKADSGVGAYTRPFVFQPGTRWAYGIGVDWAGIVLERVTGQTLEQYFQEHVFAPLGISDLTFYITPENAGRFQTVQARDGDSFKPGASFRDKTPGVRYAQLSGGGGLVGTVKDYLRFLQAVLGARDAPNAVVSAAAYKELFTDSLSDEVRASLNARPDKALKQRAGAGPALGWSVGLELDLLDGEFGRKRGSGYWGGAAKTGFWIDPASGVVAIVATQILTPGALADLGFKKVKDEFEREVYAGLV
ncbi:hypothetical protein Q8F55_004437 [Vanrija albida]|uniref:Beta-lactamase-related domain-containing protein n=1 Tax=Vanrija albida TaxID=181172 RepID=A0ABR3Q6R5_9TREE